MERGQVTRDCCSCNRVSTLSLRERDSPTRGIATAGHILKTSPGQGRPMGKEQV
jgi:hypothetical protein